MGREIVTIMMIMKIRMNRRRNGDKIMMIVNGKRSVRRNDDKMMMIVKRRRNRKGIMTK